MLRIIIRRSHLFAIEEPYEVLKTLTASPCVLNPAFICVDCCKRRLDPAAKCWHVEQKEKQDINTGK